MKRPQPKRALALLPANANGAAPHANGAAEHRLSKGEIDELVAIVNRIREAKQHHSDLDREVAKAEEARRQARLSIVAIEGEVGEFCRRAAVRQGLDVDPATGAWVLDVSRGAFVRRVQPPPASPPG